MRLPFEGGAVEVEGLPEVCSGHSSSGQYFAAHRGQAVHLGSLPPDVLQRLEHEAADAIAEAVADGSSDEPHVQYMRDVRRQCLAELQQRKGAA